MQSDNYFSAYTAKLDATGWPPIDYKHSRHWYNELIGEEAKEINWEEEWNNEEEQLLWKSQKSLVHDPNICAVCTGEQAN